MQNVLTESSMQYENNVISRSHFFAAANWQPGKYADVMQNRFTKFCHLLLLPFIEDTIGALFGFCTIG